MKILVTGGAGYIGSHTCKALAAAGHGPIVYDNLSRGHAGAVKWGPLVMGDIANQAHLAAVLRAERVEAVVHFAAFAYVGESMSNPGLYFQNNVTGTAQLLAAMQEAGVTKLVFSSSCATYGDPVYVPIDEAHVQVPMSPYGETKLIGEKMIRWYEAVCGFRAVLLRYFNAAGADLEGDLVEKHDPETHLVPLVVDAALGVRGPVQVFGTDYATPDGTAVRDYIHVNDLASAHLLALEHLEAGGASTAVNLGAGRGYSVREVIDCVAAVAGRPAPFTLAPRRAGDPPKMVADTKRAAELLKWTARHSDIETIVRSTYESRQQKT